MNSNVLLLGIELFTLCLFVVYNSIIFLFSDKIFQKERKMITRMGISLINLFIMMFVVHFEKSGSLFTYTILYIVLFVEFFIFYKNKLSRNLLIVTIFISHIIAIRTIILSGTAWLFNCSVSTILANSEGFLLTLMISLFVLMVATLIVMRVIPIEKIRLVLQRDDQSFFLLIWLTVCTIYLLINSQVYAYDMFIVFAYQDQILKFITILIGIYIIIFYSISNSTLLSVKLKNQELQAEIKKQENYRDVIIGNSKYSFEANLSKNIITRGFGEYNDILKELNYSYDKVITTLCQRLFHPNDVEKSLSMMSTSNLIFEYHQGIVRHELEFRLLDKVEGYYWVQVITNTICDDQTNDILIFAYFVDIDHEKREELLLKNRAEKDGLTGLYNKVTTEFLVSEKLKIENGVLFIIDVDNFKSVNDYFGHAKGDEVLKQLAEELKWIFRKDDIVGRIGGDEFMVFMSMQYDEDFIYKKAEDILRRFFKSFEDSSGRLHTISASIGVSKAISEKSSFNQLYKQADTALYHSKNKGKNTVYIYDGSSFVSYVSNRGVARS